MHIPKYQHQTKPHLVVEAIQLTEDNIGEVANWTQSQIIEERDALSHETFEALNLKTPDGKRRASIGAMIVKWEGDFYVGSPTKFNSLYHQTDSTESN